MLKGHIKYVNSISRVGKLLATSSDDKTLRLWSMITMQEIWKMDIDLICV